MEYINKWPRSITSRRLGYAKRKTKNKQTQKRNRNWDKTDQETDQELGQNRPGNGTEKSRNLRRLGIPSTHLLILVIFRHDRVERTCCISATPAAPADHLHQVRPWRCKVSCGTARLHGLSLQSSVEALPRPPSSLPPRREDSSRPCKAAAEGFPRGDYARRRTEMWHLEWGKMGEKCNGVQQSQW